MAAVLDAAPLVPCHEMPKAKCVGHYYPSILVGNNENNTLEAAVAADTRTAVVDIRDILLEDAADILHERDAAAAESDDSYLHQTTLVVTLQEAFRVLRTSNTLLFDEEQEEDMSLLSIHQDVS